MGLAIALEDERGERIETVIDPTNLLHRLLLHYQGQESLLGQIGTAIRCSIAFKCLFFSLRGEHLLAKPEALQN
jgi:hypothetical protein